MIIEYHCPVCENKPTTCIPILFPRRPIIVQCPFCWTEVEIVARQQLAELNVKDVMKEVEMILSGNK